MSPMIVIADRSGSHHARLVGNHLQKRGARVFIADVQELGAGAEISFCPNSPKESEWRRRNGEVLRMSEASVVWYRPGNSPDIPIELSDQRERPFVAREWRELVCGLLTSLDVPMINPFHAAADATKPYQLVLARRVGLAVPDTIVTNSARRAMEFVTASGCAVHKTLTGIAGRTLATKRWDDDARFLHELELAPTILQRRVDGTRELRITAVGDRLFAAEFSTPFVDARLDRAVTHVPHELPTHVERALLCLMEQLSLSVATIDMRIDGRGEYQFLEINPSGGVIFLWIEVRTGMPISEAIADLLYDVSRGGSS